MLKIFKKENGILIETKHITPNCWINVFEPSSEELNFLVKHLPWIDEYIYDPLDLDEKARVEKWEDIIFTLVRIPVFNGKNDEMPFSIMPLGIIMNKDTIVTICREENVILRDFELNKVKGFSLERRSQFLLLLLFRIASKFLTHLREINKMVESLEDNLHSSMRNQDLIELLKYQKSLVYYATALKSNELMLRKLSRFPVFKISDDDDELLEDVDIEFQQAIEMTNIANNILAQLTSSYASIINNNMNIVIKTLTLITIVLYIPTLIASLYGMNVKLPFQDAPYAFEFILSVSLLISCTILFIFVKRKWF